ncbi:DUF5615 family PIN-like protein [Belliella sp. R4-6]|uniref:DUF5615 family PIN-like protein n=1 Tax=Belliella alkalica TaxID=1730871 RepID=A0ABS9VCB2_9BACT|nr:DUF5615 family PIN-like protein [Belliella alkalica]MCH7414064.1 DUF5615 family PIN-like protein [Belliella alkalica]
MKFLLGAQLPPLLCEILKQKGHEAIHVLDLPNGDESTDKEVATFADDNELTLISKDSHFHHSHILLKSPKKLLVISTGNIKNRVLFDLVRKNILKIEILFEESDYLELSLLGLFAHGK